MKTRLLFLLLVMSLFSSLLVSQVNMGASPTTYSQDFNTLISTGSGTWSDNITIGNWYAKRTGTGTSIAADTGSGNGGNLYSYGSSSATDRALGSLGSGNAAAGHFAWGVLLKNTGVTPISEITISYYGEQWRKSGVIVPQVVSFYYKTSSSSITDVEPNVSSGWTAVSGLNFSSPINTTTGSALDGNASANRVSITSAISGLYLAVDSYILLKWDDPDHSGSDHGLAIDDVSISWVFGGSNTPPNITNILQTPSSNIISSTTVSVSADISDSDGTVGYASLSWGTTSGDYANEINMSLDTESVYITDTPIPAQPNGTTVYYVVYAEDDTDNSQSGEQSYTVRDPATSTIPYVQDFSAGFGDTYTYTVSGTKPWYIYNSDVAAANGYQSALEEQWLVLPAINFDNYTYERMLFNVKATYGTIDANNYLNLYYSPDYYGLGNPTSSTWTEIPFAQPTVGSAETSSGVLDLTGISGTNVYLAFKYYSTTTPTWFEIDDISIYLAMPVITVSTATLSGFTYPFEGGPSDPQSFIVSGTDLTGDILISAPANYEIIVNNTKRFGYSSQVTLHHSGGVVTDNTIDVRLKQGLAIGTYNGETINITSDDAVAKTVTCDGEVTTPPAPDAPFATEATSITADGFTANWDPVDGATSYKLDVYSGTTTELVNTGFEGSTSFPDGWTQNSSYIGNISGNQYAGTNYAGMNAIGDYFYTGLLSSPATISFWVRTSSATANYTLLVQYSSDGSNWTEFATYSANGADTGDITVAYSQKTINANLSGDYYIGWTIPLRSGGSAYIDEVLITGGSIAYEAGYQDLTVNGNSQSVSALDSNTTYYYVVRAVNDHGTSANSNEISVTTSNFDYPEGTPITDTFGNVITVTGGSANEGTGVIPGWNNGTFNEATSFYFDLIGTGPWTITIETTALWGAYYQNGEWHPVEASGGFITFVITAAKDLGVPVVLGDADPTLPVELSSFTATITNELMVKIAWVAQSETNHSGYNVLRAEANELSGAIRINPNLIDNGTNLGTQISYSYTDNEAYSNMQYYYWLESISLDGISEYYGPLSVTIGDPNLDPLPPAVPLATKLLYAFPNPFNPNTNIRYSVREAGKVNIDIYNVKGQLVRSFKAEHNAPGYYQVNWDGRDANGKPASSGIYMYRMSSGKYSSSKKMILAK